MGFSFLIPAYELLIIGRFVSGINAEVQLLGAVSQHALRLRLHPQLWPRARWRNKHFDHRALHSDESPRSIHDRRFSQLAQFILYQHGVPLHSGTSLRDAILKYLSAAYCVPDHWYPQQPQKRARVDEYTAWHHMNTRLHSSKVFITEVGGAKEGIINITIM
ncbi:hypothetical protein HF521_014372 [Silurus meridionalis]|uniref:Uncharacterized protein n=1 Tax=Silurus meridionalis TaxID=175797 RepID=A0A8T0A673_SILME|nr:hypothetical protein HF521_014372 [Silurus meridionalis]